MTARLRAPQCQRSGRRRSQAGYLLFEATVAVALIASAVVAYLSLQTVQTRIDNGIGVGAHYARVNDALGQYMTLHYAALKTLPPDCSVHGLASTTSKTRPSLGEGCKLSINGESVSNGLQPAVAELVALSLLPAATTDALRLNTLSTISEPETNGSGSSKLTRARLHAVITQRCVATQAASTLRGRYVLIRRPVATDNLALDEIEVLVNGSNVAGSAVLSASTAFTDGQTNAAAYYAPRNLVDRLQTLAPSSPYQVPGLFRSLGSNPGGAWVQLDLGMTRDISSIGLRSAQGNTGSTGSTWAVEGLSMSVQVNNEAAETGNFLMTGTSQIREAKPSLLLPGKMVYVSSDAFSAGAPLDLTPTAQGCPSGSLMALSSLVFNTQPYALTGEQGSGALLATVTQAAGTEAVMSNPVSGGELSSRVFSIDNPLRNYEASEKGIGVGGIIAVRNGYDSYSTSLQTRADGSNLPTAAWNFNSKNLTGVDHLESASASVRGDLTTQGALSANKAGFNELKLPLAVAGNACEKLSQSIAQNTDGHLLTCAGSLWKSAQADTVNSQEYYEIDLIRTPPAGLLWPSVKRCLKEICTDGSGRELGTLLDSNNRYKTRLRYDAWFPVVMGHTLTESSGTPRNPIDTSFSLSKNEEFWSVDVTGGESVVKLKLRFYKINN
jgi:hypothetical protein